MGFFDWIGEQVDRMRGHIDDAKEYVKDKFEYWKFRLEEKLSSENYDEDSVEDHVNVDETLADFRESIQADVDNVEKECLKEISVLFSDLTKKTKERFPDLVGIIKHEQEKAEYELDGTIMKYVKEHLSKNDAKFLKVLKMQPGKAKENALDRSTDQVLDDAVRTFNSKLKKYAERVLEEFTKRLDTRISNQEEQMNQRIQELEQMQADAESGKIDIDALKDSYAPMMESAVCIINILEMEM